MNDGVSKGQGNSRYLKSNIPASTTLQQLISMLNNGTFPVDFNGINEAGWLQIGTALNKANLFSDQTAAKYPDGTETVDGALQFFGTFNQYWWKRRKKETNFGAIEDVTLASGSDTTYYANWNKSLTVDTTGFAPVLNGDITLVKVNRNSAGATTANGLKGYYFQFYSSNGSSYDNGMFHADSNAPDAVYDGSKVTIQAKRVTIEYSEWEYINSGERDAYPDSGVSGEYEYQYLGIPMENAVSGAKLYYGSYVGTDTHGESYPTSLTFSFVPKLVIVARAYGTGASLVPGGDYWTSSFIWIPGVDKTKINSDSYVYITLENNTLSWYAEGNYGNQLNNIGETYSYLAIG